MKKGTHVIRRGNVIKFSNIAINIKLPNKETVAIIKEQRKYKKNKLMRDYVIL